MFFSRFPDRDKYYQQGSETSNSGVISTEESSDQTCQAGSTDRPAGDNQIWPEAQQTLPQVDPQVAPQVELQTEGETQVQQRQDEKKLLENVMYEFCSRLDIKRDKDNFTSFYKMFQKSHKIYKSFFKKVKNCDDLITILLLLFDSKSNMTLQSLTKQQQTLLNFFISTIHVSGHYDLLFHFNYYIVNSQILNFSTSWYKLLPRTREHYMLMK